MEPRTELQALYLPSHFNVKSLEGKAVFFSLDYQERHYTTCEVGQIAFKGLA